MTTSGLDGSFRIGGVPAGNFRVRATEPLSGAGGQASGNIVNEAQVVTVTVAVTVPTVALGRVEGVVRRADGTIATGAQVTLAYGRTQRTTSVDADGFYGFDSVPLGAFSLLARAQVGADGGSARGDLAFADEIAHIDLEFLGVGAVEGIVVDGGGAPVPFATVDLRRAGATPYAFNAQTVAGADGRFRFSSVLTGDLSASARHPILPLGGGASGNLAGLNATLTLTVPAGRRRRDRGPRPAPGWGDAGRRYRHRPGEGEHAPL